MEPKNSAIDKFDIVARNHSEEYIDLAKEIYKAGLMRGYGKRYRGTWIVRADDKYPYSCNTCGNYTNEVTPYCAWCGAKMKD